MAAGLALAALLTISTSAQAQSDGQELLDQAIESLEFGDEAAYQQAVDNIATSGHWFPSTLGQALDERDLELIIMVWFVIDAPDNDVLRTAMDIAAFERDGLLFGDPNDSIDRDALEHIDRQGLTALETIEHRGLPTTTEINSALSLLPADDDNVPDEIVYNTAIGQLAGVMAGTLTESPTVNPPIETTPVATITRGDALLDETTIEAAVDTEQAILQDALVVLEAEREVIKRMPMGTAPPDELRTKLMAADQAGEVVMARADAAGVDLSPETRFVLSRMPRPEQGDRRVPADYDAAVAVIETRLESAATAPSAIAVDETPTEPSIEPTEGGLPATPLDSRAATSSPSRTTDTAQDPSSDATPWIAFGIISLAAVALGMFALQRSREAHGLIGLANTDGLTGLHNRRKLDADIEDHRARVDTPVALLMIDVDSFKHFNDEHGHSTGDAVLRLVGTALAGAVRRNDVVYRYGGEEFCALLPNAFPDEAHRIAERIRAAVQAINLPVDATLTASVGLASGQSSQLKTLVDDADGALYAAKQAGRNRVMTADADRVVAAQPRNVMPR